MNFLEGVDYWLFTLINGLAGRYPWLDGLVCLLLNDYFVPTVLALALLTLWFEQDKNRVDSRNLIFLSPNPPIPAKTFQENCTSNQRAVLVATLSAALVNILLKGMNLLYFRPRPFDGYRVNLLFYQPTDSSFPSNAAALGFAIAVGVWFHHRAWGWNLLALAALFGLSRILGGVHYPLDVIAGAALGWGSAWLIQRQSGLVDKLLGMAVNLANRLDLV